MLFNSSVFLFAFLPIVLAGWHLLKPRAPWRLTVTWLVAASLVFYGWFNPVYILFILGSIAGNYRLGLAIAAAGAKTRKPLMLAGVAANLGLLGYFKYANFLVATVNGAAGTAFDLGPIVLPLAISFFTFQQVAYLVDVWKGRCEEHDFLDYCLFVTFFPQLIAGPIVHHSEMMPHFRRPIRRGLLSAWTAWGLSVLAVGLFKKAVIADGLALYADPVFDAAAAGTMPTFIEAWGGALAYTLQIYFDFSGYSEMAIGLGLLFGVRLPLNFASPYKATNIVEFWRRWHITLSRFLRDYLYIPLGGNRKGPARRSANLMATMLLGGLWHGAGWTFVAWGCLHGLYLLVNHAWRGATGGRSFGRAGALAGWALTFLGVVVAWVFFRAADFPAAFAMLAGMAGANGVVVPAEILARLGGAQAWAQALGIAAAPGDLTFFFGMGQVAALAAALAIAVGLPNVHELLVRRRADGRAGLVRALRWRLSPAWGLAAGGAVAAALFGVVR
ncbi:MAG TPA: MBOAT family protein, partial [Candidatus Omnitrophota bacterium]|nr:MBOAT family protein [Candidatus Omnitrophota bacterium]